MRTKTLPKTPLIETPSLISPDPSGTSSSLDVPLLVADLPPALEASALRRPVRSCIGIGRNEALPLNQNTALDHEPLPLLPPPIQSPPPAAGCSLRLRLRDPSVQNRDQHETMTVSPSPPGIATAPLLPLSFGKRAQGGPMRLQRRLRRKGSEETASSAGDAAHTGIVLPTKRKNDPFETPYPGISRVPAQVLMKVNDHAILMPTPTVPNHQVQRQQPPPVSALLPDIEDDFAVLPRDQRRFALSRRPQRYSSSTNRLIPRSSDLLVGGCGGGLVEQPSTTVSMAMPCF